MPFLSHVGFLGFTYYGASFISRQRTKILSTSLFRNIAEKTSTLPTKAESDGVIRNTAVALKRGSVPARKGGRIKESRGVSRSWGSSGREILSASKWHNTIFVSSRDAPGEFAPTQGVRLSFDRS